MKTRNAVLVLLVAGSMVGCMVGPTYRPPVSSQPGQWSEPLAGGETDHAAAVATWWKSFGDPELDSLVERALQANLDLRIAQARVRAARAERGIVTPAAGPVSLPPARPSGRSRAPISRCSVRCCRPAPP